MAAALRGRLPAHRHGGDVRERGRDRRGAGGQRPGPGRGLRHDQDPAVGRGPGAGGAAPVAARRCAPSTWTCGSCTGRRTARRQRRQIWNDMRQLRDEGLVRAIGVSNYSLAQIDELIEATGEAPGGEPDPVEPVALRPGRLVGHKDRGMCWRATAGSRTARLTDPVLTEIAAAHQVTAGPGGAALAPGARHHGHPEVGAARSGSRPTSTCSASRSARPRWPGSTRWQRLKSERRPAGRTRRDLRPGGAAGRTPGARQGRVGAAPAGTARE